MLQVNNHLIGLGGLQISASRDKGMNKGKLKLI